MSVRPSFTSAAAAKAWDDHFAEVDRLLARAGLSDSGLGDDLRRQLHDRFLAEPGEREPPRLQAAIGQVGRPAERLREELAKAMLDRGSRTGHPVTIALGLWHALFTGTREALLATAFGLGYAVVIGLMVLALLKPVLFRNVGLVRDPVGQLSLGTVTEYSGSTEVLGWWTIPIGLGLGAVLYLTLTLLLRWSRSP